MFVGLVSVFTHKVFYKYKIKPCLKTHQTSLINMIMLHKVGAFQENVQHVFMWSLVISSKCQRHWLSLHPLALLGHLQSHRRVCSDRHFENSGLEMKRVILEGLESNLIPKLLNHLWYTFQITLTPGVVGVNSRFSFAYLVNL